MCSNQKGRQLSAFLLLAPLRNVELPENVVLHGNVEPPGNVENRLDDADDPVLAPPSQPPKYRTPRQRRALRERRAPWERRAPARWCGLLFPLSRLPQSRSNSLPALDHCQSSARFTSPAVTGLE